MVDTTKSGEAGTDEREKRQIVLNDKNLLTKNRQQKSIVFAPIELFSPLKISSHSFVIRLKDFFFTKKMCYCKSVARSEGGRSLGSRRRTAANH